MRTPPLRAEVEAGVRTSGAQQSGRRRPGKGRRERRTARGERGGRATLCFYPPANTRISAGVKHPGVQIPASHIDRNCSPPNWQRPMFVWRVDLQTLISQSIASVGCLCQALACIVYAFVHMSIACCCVLYCICMDLSHYAIIYTYTHTRMHPS